MRLKQWGSLRAQLRQGVAIVMLAAMVAASSTLSAFAATGITSSSALIPDHEVTFSIPPNNLYAFALSVDSAGYAYVGLLDDNVVKKFDSNGNYLTEWGSYGSGNGQFDQIKEVATDVSGYVYVADGNNRIQKFDSNGTYIGEWGTSGMADGQFGAVSAIAFDSDGNFYVTDGQKSCIQKFDSNGTFIGKWGTAGSGDGQFVAAYGIALDSNNNVYVSDISNSRVQKFDSNGTFIGKWGTAGSGDGQFDFMGKLAIDSQDNIYVADAFNNRVQKFDSNGTFIGKWGTAGSGDGQMQQPGVVEVDSADNVYVLDSYFRVQKFSYPRNIATVNSEVGSGSMSMRLADTLNITDVTSSAPTNADKKYATGVINTSFENAEPSIANMISVFFETDLLSEGVNAFMYNPTTRTSTLLQDAIVTATTQNGKTGLLVTYQITDNDSSDTNAAPGVITHSIGLVAVENTNNGGGDNDSGATNGLGGSRANGDTLAETGVPVGVTVSGAVVLLAAGLTVARRYL